MRKKYKLKRTYKAVHFYDFIWTKNERRILISSQKITYIDDDIIRTDKKKYIRKNMELAEILQNTTDELHVQVPFLCDCDTGKLVNETVKYMEKIGSKELFV